ncbi:MAG: aminoglycoside phosphotransferase (APT) family kinase protein [Candidatus Poriferisodalaceae bacterium]
MAANNLAGISDEAVTEWFVQNIGGVALPLTFELLAGGHSNLTYRVTDAAKTDFVLRRPPLGHVLATAHDMEREHRIISGVGKTNVPVPAALGLCEDVSVNDAPFYVMDHVVGTVLHTDEEVAGMGGDEKMALSRHVVDVLADLHAVEPGDIGLGELGKREEYIGRQLRRWTKQWLASKTRELPEMEETQRLLDEGMPEQIGAAIVHGDYRLGNMLTGEGRVLAVLDWELCTLGDPMADVGYLMNNWVEPGEALPSSSAPTIAGGFATRDQMLGWYQDATGRDVGKVAYYRAFSYWRLAAIVEGVLNRYLNGAMGQEGDTEMFKLQVETLATNALTLLSEG